MVLNIEPIQEGSGDPSPDNIRPISGWTGATVTRTGKNLADFENGKGIDVSGDIADAAARIATVNAIKIDTTKTYYLSFIEDTDFRALYCIYSNSSMIRRVTGVRSGTAINVQDGDFLRVCIYNDNGSRQATVENQKPQLEIGTATDYVPYTGATIPISWETEAGAVYGAELDVVSGRLTVTHRLFNPTGLEYNYQQQTNRIAFALPNDIRTGGTRNVPCSDFSGVITSATYCYVPTSMTVAELKSYFATHTVDMVCKLTTPLEYQLTPQQILALFGTNVVWSDAANSIEMQYTGYIDD